LNKIIEAIIFLFFTVLTRTFQNIKIGKTTFSIFMPWNNYQGVRVYAKTVKYTNIIAFKIFSSIEISA
jgi:hypothetical protein